MAKYEPVTAAVVEELCASSAMATCCSVIRSGWRPTPMTRWPVRSTPTCQSGGQASQRREISAILRLANRERIPVTPRGGDGAVVRRGAGLWRHPALVERMNRSSKSTARTWSSWSSQAGDQRDQRCCSAVRPVLCRLSMSVESCFVGGNVAENAGGAGRSSTVSPAGTCSAGGGVAHRRDCDAGRKRVKDVTGYDLVHLMVGSEGTLGIFTRITYASCPASGPAVLLVPFANVRRPLRVPQVMARATWSRLHRVHGSAVGADCVRLSGRDPAHPEIGAMLLLEVDGYDKEQVEREMETVADLCLARGAGCVRRQHARHRAAHVAATADDRRSIQGICRCRAWRHCGTAGSDPELVPELERLSAQYDVLIPVTATPATGISTPRRQAPRHP